MKSFGLWYKKKDGSGTDPEFSLHINFWSESVKEDGVIPDLDVGIKISSFRAIETLVFHCPFEIDDNDVTDLVPVLKKLENANIVFNAEGKIDAESPYSVYHPLNEGKEEKLLLFPLRHNPDGIYSLDRNLEGTEIVFKFDIFNEYIKTRTGYNDIKYAYIRFRISSKELKNSIYFDCEPSNKSFESAFTGARIFDFIINDKRGLGSKIIAKIDMEKFVIPTLKDNHLLIIEPASYDVESFSKEEMACRELEENMWEEYLGANINYSAGRVLVYHWKYNTGCSCLVKIKYSKTNSTTLEAYIVMVIALGVVASAIVAAIQSIVGEDYSWLISILVGIVLFAIGLYRGNQ